MGKMLVADDDSMVRECVKAILSALGHEVIEAKDGLEALMVFQALRSEIALVLMDVNMPRMDGIAATKVIKMSAPEMKVILLSGHHEHVDGDVLVDAFLSKPFRARELAAVIQQVMGDGRPAPWVEPPRI